MKKGELYLINFPSKSGREQTGARPSIIIADTKTDLSLVIPLTSNLEALTKLPFTLKINKSSQNKLDRDSVALVFQLQAIDKKRFMAKIGNLEESYLKKIDIVLKEILKLE